MYGFRKENKEKKTRQEEYKHEYFKKGHRELLKNITRRRKGEEEPSLGSKTYSIGFNRKTTGSAF